MATVKSNGIEDYIDAIHLFRHGVDVLFDRVLIERIYLRDFDNASIGSDLLGDRIDWFQHTTGKEDVGALTGEGSGNSTAYRTAGSVDHSVLFLSSTSVPRAMQANWTNGPEVRKERPAEAALETLSDSPPSKRRTRPSLITHAVARLYRIDHVDKRKFTTAPTAAHSSITALGSRLPSAGCGCMKRISFLLSEHKVHRP